MIDITCNIEHSYSTRTTVDMIMSHDIVMWYASQVYCMIYISQFLYDRVMIQSGMYNVWCIGITYYNHDHSRDITSHCYISASWYTKTGNIVIYCDHVKNSCETSSMTFFFHIYHICFSNYFSQQLLLRSWLLLICSVWVNNFYLGHHSWPYRHTVDIVAWPVHNHVLFLFRPETLLQNLNWNNNNGHGSGDFRSFVITTFYKFREICSRWVLSSCNT